MKSGRERGSAGLRVKSICAKEKQASAKQTFGFPARITSKRPMKSGRECGSTGLRVAKV